MNPKEHRGFSTLELLIAFAIAISSIVSIALLAWGLPIALENAALELGAYKEGEAHLHSARLNNLATSTARESPPYTTELSIDMLPGETSALVIAKTSWLDARQQERTITLTTAVVDLDASVEIPCLPFSLGDWSRPVLSPPRALSEAPSARFSVSALAATRDVLAVAAGTAATSTDPTLLFFSINADGGLGSLLGTADNASTSLTGFEALAANGAYLYAANGFGSGSARTCATGACAQLQVFEVQTEPAPRLVSRLQLPTHTGPKAVTFDDSSASAQAVAYRKGFVFMGLVKTAAGSEFNIIDVQDPVHPVWRSGVPIGRSVNSIAIHGSHAYLATSDPNRELVVIDVSTIDDPRIAGSWNAPGPANFGIGNTVAVRGERAYLGRSYAPSAAELIVLDIHDPGTITPLAERDAGTARDPSTMRTLLARDSTLLSLSSKRMSVWRGIPHEEKEVWSEEVRGSVALSCSGNTIYVASVDSLGAASLRTLQAH